MDDLVARIREEQRQLWQTGQRVPVEDYLVRHPELSANLEATLDLICSEVLLRRELGEQPAADEYLARFPQHADSVRRQFELFELLDEANPTKQSHDTNATAVFGPAEGSDGAGQTTAAPVVPELPGYEILVQLGRGTGGVVYLANQLRLDRLVAVKMLRPEALAESKGLELFRREAAAVARLQHPNVVQVFDSGEHEGRPFFTMELVEGGSLQQKFAGQPLPPREAAGLVETLARAMQVAHDRGIVHRDLKPANILLTPDGIPKVADFGLAKRMNGGESLAASGDIIGTAAYMAPEQAAGKTKEIGPAADIYALGAILYEALTGQPPFLGDTWADTLHRIQFHELVPPRRKRKEVPRDLDTICLKCLRKDPRKRYMTALALAEDLRRFLSGEPIQARPERLHEKIVRVVCKNRLWNAAALVLLCVTGGALLPMYFREQEDPERPRRELKERLAQGRPYVFEGTERLPGPFRQELYHPFVYWTNETERCMVIETLEIILWELTDDPMCQSYRFSAEVRHDAAGGNASSQVGLYLGYRSQFTQGFKRSGFYHFCFADRGALAAAVPYKIPMSWVMLKPRLFDGETGLMPRGSALVKKPFEPEPFALSAPWRKLQAVVDLSGVELSWEKTPGDLERIGHLGAAELETSLDKTQVSIPLRARVPGSYQPRLSLGLYVATGRCSFRKITLEPLPNGG